MRNIFQTLYRRPGKPWRPARGPGSALTISFPVALAFMLSGIGGAVSGPCADQIAELERQVAAIAPGGQGGPSAQQSVGAQLHRQPTPSSVHSAEGVATGEADDALARAKQADATGNAADCNAALRKAQELYASIDGPKRTLAASLRAPVIENVQYRTGWCAGASALRDRFCQQSF